MSNWEDVRLPWFEATPFHPRLDSDAGGLALWVPERISVARVGTRIPVFGTVRQGTEGLKALAIEDGHPARGVILGLITGAWRDPYVGEVVGATPLFPKSTDPSPTDYFAVDLAEVVKVAAGPGLYFVFGSIGTTIWGPKPIEVVR